MLLFAISNTILKQTAPKSKWNLRKKFPKLFFHPHMKWDEYILFEKLCKNKKTVIEYGSGGSTIFFLKGKTKVYSVESNREFYEFMQSIPFIEKSLNHSLQYNFIDLGATDQWGAPLSEDKKANWPLYYTQVWDSIENKTTIDAIFIDGRFRVSCCLYSILQVLEHGAKDTLFLIHDFWKRKHYHIVLQYLKEYKSASNLGSFHLKENIDIEEVRALLHEYALNDK